MSNENTANQDSSPKEEVKELSKEEKIEVYKEWIEALRSGKYKQTKNVLKTRLSLNNEECGYCCLGVLCEIEKERFGLTEYAPSLYIEDEEDEGKEIPNPNPCFIFDETEESLPVKAIKALGWADNNYLGLISGNRKLAALNDEGVEFPEIADIIEDEFLKPLLETKDE